MVRPRGYDRETVLDNATLLFWQKGYHGTSLSELVSVTGLNKHSMYREFGSKAGLFEECLENYKFKVARELLDILKKEPLGLENIRAFFKNRIEFICSENFICCLIVKSTIEKEFVEETAMERVGFQNRLFEMAFMDCLIAAINLGEISDTADPVLLSRYLLNYYTGMLVSGKPENGIEEAFKLFEMAMSVIEIK